MFTLLVGFYICHFLDVGTQVVEGIGNPYMRGFLSSRATAIIAAIPPSWFPHVSLEARSARHLIFTSIISHPPSSSRLCSVDSGTRNMEPCHIYHTTADTNCLRHSLGGCSTCAVYHSLASMYTCMYVIRRAMLRSLLYARCACVHTNDFNLVQLASPNFFNVFLIFMPRIVISSL